VDTLERIAGMRSKTLEDDLISWPESGGEGMETVERMNKEKGREVVEEKCDDEWSEMDIEDRGDRIEMGAETQSGHRGPRLSMEAQWRLEFAEELSE